MVAAKILEVTNLVKNFSGNYAIDNLSFSLETGTITAVIGPNGAGKTTLYKLISGQLVPTSGTIKLKGKKITGLAPHKIVKAGIGRSFQITSVFPGLTVQQNVRVAIVAQTGRQFDLWNCLDRDRDLDRSVIEILERVGIPDLANILVRNLSHGERALVEIAIVLACKPSLILLDEPTAGMSRQETNRIVKLIENLQQKTGWTFLMTEHDMKVIFNLAEKIIAIDRGRMLAAGTPQEIRANGDVRRAYLGTIAR